MTASTLTARDVAARLGVSRGLVYSLAKRGELPCYRIGGALRFAEAEIAAWLQGRRGADADRPMMHLKHVSC